MKPNNLALSHCMFYFDTHRLNTWTSNAVCTTGYFRKIDICTFAFVSVNNLIETNKMTRKIFLLSLSLLSAILQNQILLYEPILIRGERKTKPMTL